MSIVFACAASHAPGMRAWPDKAHPDQLDRITAAWDGLRRDLEKSNPEVLVLLTSDHWANFFLDHMGAFCIGRGERFEGPVEPWLRVEHSTLRGEPAIADDLLQGAYSNGFELSFSYELRFDHGTMVPLSFLTPKMDKKVVPIFFNALAPPRPNPARCVELGRVLGRYLRNRPERIGIIATGGLSHDPGERNHGFIDTAFDESFLRSMSEGATDTLSSYTDAGLFGAGGGAPELLAWLALAGAMEGHGARILCYEAVSAWATGIGMIKYERAC
jgi:aromatic ring-opening dioxygenase catalytic subunit (LigB family)